MTTGVTKVEWLVAGDCDARGCRSGGDGSGGGGAAGAASAAGAGGKKEIMGGGKVRDEEF